MRKLLWSLLMPVVILFGIGHLVIFAIVDLVLMCIGFMAKEKWPSFGIVRQVFTESVSYYRGIFAS